MTNISAREKGIIFADPYMASKYNERPILIVPGKETPELTKAMVDHLFGTGPEREEGTWNDLRANGVNVTLKGSNDKEVPAHFGIKYCHCQIDGKQVAIQSGLGGAYCRLCFATRAEGKDLEWVKKEFRQVGSHLNLAQFFEMLNQALSMFSEISR